MRICSFFCFILFCLINNAAAKIAEIPFALQWLIPENRLLPLNDSVNGYLMSNTVSNIPEFEYYLQISPNGHNNNARGYTFIFLWLEFKNVKKVDVNYTFTIESANFSRTEHAVYEETIGWGFDVCKTIELFDPVKKNIFDGKFFLKVNGTFKFESADGSLAQIDGEQQKWQGGNLGDELWKNDETKDFTIIAEDKEIKVHKFILAIRSPYFASIFDDINQHSAVEIIVFENISFDVVEAVIKLIYDCNFVTSFTLEDLISFLEFLDTCSLTSLKVNVESKLIEQISASTVVRLINASISTKSYKLKEKCMEFLTAAFESKTALHAIDALDKDIIVGIVKNSFYQTVGTI